MHFIRPELLLLLLLVPLLWFVMRYKQHSIGSWQKLISKPLQAYVIKNKVSEKRAAYWLPIATLFAVVLIIIAMAGPSWKKQASPIYSDQSGLIIGLDLSLSMTAQDVSPSRIQRAKYKVIDILEQDIEKSIGLIAYSGDAHTASPITQDSNTVKAILNSLDPYIMPKPGSNITRLVDEAITLFEQSGSQPRHLLLVADGVESQDINEAARKIKQANIQLSILAVGTEQGAPIVKPNGEFFRDNSGSVIMPKLEWENLQELASQSSGRIHILSNNDEDIQALLSSPMTNQTFSQMEDDVIFDQWRDGGAWLLFLALPIALLFFRKGIFYVLPLALLISQEPSYAQAYQNIPDALLNNNQLGEKYIQTQPEKSAELFNDPQWKASSLYKAEQYQEALDIWQQYDDTDSLYNAGNALAKLNRFDEALAKYNKVLERNPDHKDANQNKNLVESIKKNQQQNQPNDNQQNQQGQNNDSNSQQQDQGQQSDQQGQSNDEKSDQQKSGSENQPSDSLSENQSASKNPVEQEQDMQNQAANPDKKAQQELENKQGSKDDNGTSEQQQKAAELTQSQQQTREEAERNQALQQWMERIPDDAGGLMRRKFLYQYQQRNQNDTSGERKPW